MALVTIVALLALMEYLYFGVAVGRARVRHGIEAPAVAGDEHFERFHRAHQNTLEQLIVFIPALFAAAYYAHELFAVAVGVLFLVSRLLYFRSYIADPTKRGPGMLGSMLACVLLIAAGLLGAVHVALVT